MYLNFNIIILISILFLALLTSCKNFPKDTFQTFEEVNNGTLLVGYAANPPWVIEGEQGLDGIEVQIIKGFAKSVNAEIKWIKQNEQTLLEELENRNIHIVISGLTKKTPWRNKIATTVGYIKYNGHAHIIATPPGEHQFLFKLESYLNNNKQSIKELLNEFEKQDSP